MSTSYPAHASPRPDFSSNPGSSISQYDLLHDAGSDAASSSLPRSIAQPQPRTASSMPPLVTPSFTPPMTPGGSLDLAAAQLPPTIPGPRTEPSSTLTDEDLIALKQREQDHAASPPPTLTPLPEVNCEVRARIPTTTGQEMFLHLYHNNADNKEHLAIVFGPYIRSRSLDAPREGETEKDRMIRGAYVGTLFPGRTSSRVDALKQEAGVSGGQQGPVVLPVSPVQAPRKLEGDEGVVQPESEAAAGEKEVTDPTKEAPYVRIHSECYTGETVWSARCDCGEQLDEAARLMSLSPLGGVIVYLRQEGRGIGLLSKLKAYNLQDLGHDTLQANLLLRHPADARSYGLATAMLVDLGLGGALGSMERERGIRLLTNNPEKVRAVEGPGREVVVKERVGMVPLAWTSGGREGVQGKEVEKYISTKIEKFKHMFSS